jgi:hypothetical protein
MIGDLPTLLDKIQEDLHTKNPDPDEMLFAKSYLMKVFALDPSSFLFLIAFWFADIARVIVRARTATMGGHCEAYCHCEASDG